MLTKSKSLVFEASLDLQDLRVSTSIRLFDLRSTLSLLECIHAGVFGRVGLKRVVLTLHSEDDSWDGPDSFTIAYGDAGGESYPTNAFVSLVGRYISESGGRVGIYDASPRLRMSPFFGRLIENVSEKGMM